MLVLNELYRYRYLLYLLVERDLKKKYRRSVFGVLWSLLNPLFMMIITTMVFSTFFRFQIENFVLYLLVGQVTFSFFSEATSFAMGSIMENGALLKKVYIPKYMFPIARVLSSCINLLFTVPAMLIMMLYTGQYFDARIFTLVIPIVLLLFFCIGLGLILSTAAVYFRDIVHLYGVVLTGMSYATPIFYPEEIVPQKYQFLVECNPMYYYVKAFREVAYLGGVPDLGLLTICSGISCLVLIAGVYVFCRAEKKIILYI